MRLFVYQKNKSNGWHCLRNQDWEKKKLRYLLMEEETEMIMQYKKENNVLFIKPIIRSQLLLIKKNAHKYLALTNNTANFDDFVKVGIIGVIQSLKSYQPNRRIRLAEYAKPYIKRALIKEVHRVNASGKPRKIPWVISDNQFRICFNCHRRCLY